MLSTPELDLRNLSSAGEVNWLHGCHNQSGIETAPRYFSISGSKTGKKRDWRDTLIDVRDINHAVQATRNMSDVYFSQSSFRSNVDRKISSFQQVKVCWVDIDMYDPTYDIDAWNEIKLKKILDFSKAIGIPEPSLIINSGRGAYVKWVFKTPTNSLPVWNSLQESLTALYMDLHVDVRARDAARVFRLIDTFNSKNLARVNVLHQNQVEYDFMAFARQIQSIRVDELDGAYVKGTTKSRKTTNVMKRGASVLEGAAHGNLDALNLYTQLRAPIMLEELSERSLHWNRFADMRDLVQLRGGFRTGERDQILLWMCNSLAQAKVITPENWDAEISSLVEGFPVGPDFDPIGDGYLTSVKARLIAQTKQPESKLRLYRPRNQHLIDVLRITAQEQQNLRIIINSEEKHRRLKTKRDHKYEGRSKRRESRDTWKNLVSEQVSRLLAEYSQTNEITNGVSCSSIGFNVSEFSRFHEIDRTLISKYANEIIRLALEQKTDRDSSRGSQSIAPKIITQSEADALYHQESERIKKSRQSQNIRQEKEAHKIGDAAREKLLRLRDTAWAHEKITAMIDKIDKIDNFGTDDKAVTEKTSTPPPVFQVKTVPDVPSVPTKPLPTTTGQMELSREVNMSAIKPIDRLRSIVAAKNASRSAHHAQASVVTAQPTPPKVVVPEASPDVLAPAEVIPPQSQNHVPDSPPKVGLSASERLAKQMLAASRIRKSTTSTAHEGDLAQEDTPTTSVQSEPANDVTQFRLPMRKRPNMYPPAVQWQSSALPCGSLFSENEWAFAKKDGLHLVVEVHADSYSLERFFNPDHPDNAGIEESVTDVYGEVRHMTDPNQVKFIRAANGCCLVRNRAAHKMPEALEDQGCVMAGESYWVVRPRNHYSQDSSNYGHATQPQAGRDFRRKPAQSATNYIDNPKPANRADRVRQLLELSSKVNSDDPADLNNDESPPIPTD